jgi:hypothetical protein
VRIANNASFAAGRSALEMRTRGAKASVSLLGKVSNDVHITIEAGALSQRELEILSADSVMLSGQVKPTAYFSAGFRFYFSMSDDINELF